MSKGMSGTDGQFQERLLATFRVEAREHVDAIAAGLIALEKTSDPGEKAEVVETLIREAHSLKGAARAVGNTDVEEVCHSLESVLVALNRRQLAQSLGLFDTLHGAGDCLRNLAAETKDGNEGMPRQKVVKTIDSLEGLLKGETPERQEPPAVSPDEAPRSSVPAQGAERETVRVSTANLDAVMRQAEELFSARLATGNQVVELQGLQRRLLSLKKEWGARRWEESGNLIQSIEAMTAELLVATERGQQSVAAIVDTLVEGTKKLLMQPFSSMLELFPKLVRDLSRDQGKEARLVIQGAELEIDKRILDEMKDPLIHLLRNCIDHGIELPDERRKRGKQSHGTITVAISQAHGGNVEILVEDDGSGIDGAKVKSAAAKLGIISPEEAEYLGKEEAFSLIFRSGVSTSPIITGVSGRGIGLAIAQERVEKLGGEISAETRTNGGAAFRITIPNSLAIFRGILVHACGRPFAIPTSGVQRVVWLNREEIRTVEGREVFSLDGQAVALVRLQEILGISGNAAVGENGKATAVVLAHASKRLAVLVDEVVDEREMLVKHLGSYLRQVPNVTGATIVEKGKIVPVLFVPDMMKSTVQASATGPRSSAVPSEGGAERKKRVLVVEDSITSRMLLKNILETAGYEVGIAVDGIEAFTKLRGGGYDIVVSDVQMPRMNGFDLTAKIRADKRLEETPIVIVTALESREDRERGIEVGANAYIVKSSFDQGNLLEAVRRLL